MTEDNIERIEIKLSVDRVLKYHTFFVVPETVDGADLYFLIQEILRPLTKIQTLELDVTDV